MKRRIMALAGLFCLLLCLLAPAVPVAAAGNQVHRIDITVDLENDGSARITEVWEITAGGDITEWYLERTNLDEQEISGLAVSEDGRTFENVGEWDIDWSIDEKAGKCGVVTRGDGYELCWGVGSAGRHTFTVEYLMTNVVKGYSDSDAIDQTFITYTTDPVEQASVTIRRQGLSFEEQNTGIWGAGAAGEIHLKNGEVLAESTGFNETGYLSILVEFANGMFDPKVQRGGSFEDVKAAFVEGSSYTPNSGGEGEEGYGVDALMDSFGVPRFVRNGLFAIVPMVLFGGLALVLGAVFKNGRGAFSKGSSGTGRMKPEYKEANYARDLPFGGSLPASYKRLDDLGELKNDGDIIGALLLRWIRSRQVELVSYTKKGLFRDKEEDALQLFAPRDGMEGLEHSLYAMLQKAAGSDHILQSKEFEKWSKKNYTSVEGWFERCKNQGARVMRGMGALEDIPSTTFFGLIKTTRTEVTSEGDRLTTEMFGFKRYLKEFTIINERQAREVELWDEYLVFAQLFGIADEVAAQFKELYPDYFRKMADDLGYGNVDMFDIYIMTRMARHYSHAAYTGYRAGYDAAHSGDSWSGGGGGMSGGGGGFSSSGFGGTSGGR